MNEKNKQIAKSVIAILVAFILTFALACLNICLSAKIISSANFIKGVTEKSKYADKAAIEIKEALSDLAIPSGLPEDFFDDKVSQSQVAELFNSAIAQSFQGGAKPDFSSIKETLSKDINDYANENFVSISKETQTAIKTLTEECCNIYIRYCSPSILQFLGQIIKTLSKVIIVGIAASALLVVVALVFILRLVDRKNFLFYSFSSFLGAGLLSGIIPLVLLITNKISHVAILSKSIYGFLCSFVNGSLLIIVLFSALFVIISLLMLLLELRKK